MKAMSTSSELGTRATEALRAVLQQVSTIELKGMEIAPGAGREMDLKVRIRVLGRSHTLACRVTASSDSRTVRKGLRELLENAAQISGDTTPVFIAPYLSPEAQALCVESKAGYVDLEDNARLMLGEKVEGAEAGGEGGETVLGIEANIGDMNPQLYGYLAEKALAAGALDVTWTPGQMKKKRPGVLGSILSKTDLVNTITRPLF